MIILQKINNFSEITPEDCQAKLLWLLQCDETRHFFIPPKGDFNKDLWKKFKGSLYRISPYYFELSCSFANLSHEDAPDGLSGNFLISAQILPMEIGFADWIFSNKISVLTIDHLKTYFQAREYGLHSLIQKSISDCDLSNLINNQEDVLEFNRNNGIPRWFFISAIRIIHLSQVISNAQKRIDSYNAWVASQEERIQYAQQQLEFKVDWANIEAAEKDIARRTELAELNHQNEIENAKREQQIKKLQYELDEIRTTKASELEQAQIEHKIKLLQLERDDIKADIELKRAQIREIDDRIDPNDPVVITKKWIIITICLLVFVLLSSHGLYYIFCSWDSDFDKQYTKLSQKYLLFQTFGYDKYVDNKEIRKNISNFNYYLVQVQKLKEKTLRTRNEVRELLRNAEASCEKLEKMATYDKIGKLTYPATREDIKRLEEEFNQLSCDFKKMDIYPETASQHWLCCQTELSKCSESLKMNLPEAGKELQNAKKYFEDLRRIRNGWLDSLQSSYKKNILMSQNIKIQDLQDLQDILKEEEQTINNDMEKLKKLSSGDETYWKQLKKLENKLQIFTIRINKICEVQELKIQEEKQRNELLALWKPTSVSQKEKLSSNKACCDQSLKKIIALLKHNNIDERILEELKLIKKQWKDRIDELSSRLVDEKNFIEQQSAKMMCYYNNGKWDEAINASQKVINRCNSQKFMSQANGIKEKAQKGQLQEKFLKSLKEYHSMLITNSALKESATFLAQDLSAEQHLNELKIQFPRAIDLPAANDIENFIRDSEDKLATYDEPDLHKKISDIIENDLQKNLRAFFGELLYLFAMYYETIAHSDKQESSRFSSKAYEMYLKSANYGNQLAQRRMGYIFCLGLLGQKKNEKQVLRWLQKQNTRCKIFKQLRGF